MHGNKGSRTRKVSQEDEEIIYDWVKNFVFLYNRSIGTLSHNPLFLTLFEFQACDWLWYPLTCGPRGRVGCTWSRSLDPNFCSGQGLNLVSPAHNLWTTACTVHPLWLYPATKGC